MRLTTKIVNSELTRLGHHARLEKASGYFYFLGGEATDWISRTVPVQTINPEAVDRGIPAVEGPEPTDSAQSHAWAEAGTSGKAHGDRETVVTLAGD